jgi:hypothetical protein
MLKSERKSYESMEKSGEIIDFLARDWEIFNVGNYEADKENSECRIQ